MLNISLREIEYIITISQTESITLAADKLFVSQPALSQTIKKVENELEAPLFYRYRGRVALTEEGKQFVAAGVRIQKELRDMANRIKEIASVNGGSLVVGMPHHLGAYIVPQALAAYRSRYPNVTINLHEASPDELEKMLASGHVDVAVMPLPIKSPMIGSRPFLTDRIVLAMSANHELNRFGYTKPSEPDTAYFDLANADGATFIFGEQGQRIRTASDSVMRRAGISFGEAFFSINVETIKRLVGAGLGVTLLPESYIKTEYSKDLLNSYRLEPEQSYRWTIVAAFYSESTCTVAAESFMRVLEEVFGGYGKQETGRGDR